MKTAASLLWALSFLASATKTQTRLRQRVVDAQGADSGGQAAFSVSVSSSALEDMYLLLERAAVMPTYEVETQLVDKLGQASADVSTGPVDMDLLGITVGLTSLATRTYNQPIDNATRHQFVSEMDKLVKQLREQIHHSNAPAQARLDAGIAAYEDCNSTLFTSLHAAQAKDTDVNATRLNHSACRQQESQAWDAYAACNTTAAASAVLSSGTSASSPQAGECLRWLALQAMQPSAACSDVQPGETYEEQIIRMKQHWDDKVNEYERLKALCAQATTTTTTITDCSTDKDAWMQKKRECDAAQATFETTSCNQATMVNNAWNTYLTCHGCANQSYTQTVASEQRNLAARKAELRAAKRIECLLKVFGTNGDPQLAIDDCRAKNHSAHEINVTIEEVDEPLAPTTAPITPGTDAFWQAEYKNLPTNAPAGPMHSCTLSQPHASC
eukprot:TRINITY_DN42893_c0_g1_i1.p1 TRINITY_DN42893_c0_g1~~TRINITY_DN42893_c0_g1_i1.p1  ORF type:complete len:443 (+),score=102.54 TRINITY_DN42893_c0_g1_i1:109-1437(+)